MDEYPEMKTDINSGNCANLIL